MFNFHVLPAQEARKITNNYVPIETQQVIESIGKEIEKLANDGNSTLFISETSDIWFQYFNPYVKGFFEKLGYNVSYQYGGIDGNYWTISW